MRVLDWIAARFGYVPAEMLTEAVSDWDGEPLWGQGVRDDVAEQMSRPLTFTDTVHTQPLIIVSADFKRGIPCS